MKASNYNLLLGKLCASINEGNDKSEGETYVCNSNIVRIVAKDDSYIKSSIFEEDTTGILLPSGNVEYFKVNIGDIITVISGEINISSVK